MSSVICSSCGQPMTRVAHHEFTPDESAVLHRKQLGVDITGRVEEWACHHCGNRDFVWV